MLGQFPEMHQKLKRSRETPDSGPRPGEKTMAAVRISYLAREEDTGLFR